MLEKIALLDSTVIRALVVALVGVVGMICSFFGVSEALFANDKIEKLADGIATLATLGGVLWAGWARATKPTPPLTQMAVDKTIEDVTTGKLTGVTNPPRRQGGFLRLGLAPVLAAVALAALLGGGLAGCTGTKAAYTAAQTRPETALPDTAYVVAEHYRAVLREAVELKEAGRLPASVVERLQQADAKVKPLILGDPAAVPPKAGLRQLAESFQAVRNAATEAELQRAVDAAVLALADFIKAVDDARRSAP
jgi:hypothetical protein